MHVTLAAIRAGRPRTRFATTGSHRRERQQGLQRGLRPAFGRGRPAGSHQGSPLAALRRAARSFRHPQPALTPFLVRRSTGPSWSRAGEPRRAAPRSAAPWRG